MSDKKFTVYRSSAGSGKTFTLVKEYLKLVTADPAKYRHILAITFTNKAASEMKERILHHLQTIASAHNATDNQMLQSLVEETNIPAEQIIEKAGLVLKAILHNYSDFAVSTIDSFTHRIIRTFAHDLHLPVNFDIEIDSKRLLEESVDMLMAQIGMNKQLTELLLDFAIQSSDNDQSWHIEKRLYTFSNQLLNEEGVMHLEHLNHLDLNGFISIKNNIYKHIKQFELKLVTLGTEAITLIEKHNIPLDAFSYGKVGGIGFYFYKLKNKTIEQPGSNVLKTIEKTDWSGKSASAVDKQEIATIQPTLLELINKIQDIFEQEYADYTLMHLVSKSIYQMAVLRSVQEMMQELKKRQNIIPLAEFNKHIAAIVFNEPIPFIYERLGEKYKHFLIDEFQDTSVLQWNNLLPLIENALSEEELNILVGDGKQAIYRFRNGDVQQFVQLPKLINPSNNEILQERELMLELQMNAKHLDKNYRSKREIIEFNNSFFECTKQLLAPDAQLIYERHAQKYKDDNTGGAVHIAFAEPDIKKDAFELFQCNAVDQAIQESIQAGYTYAHLAVICRKNKEATIIANHLTSQGIPVISAESLLIANDADVCFVISLLSLLSNADNAVAKTDILNYFISKKLLHTNLHQALKESQARKEGSIKLFCAYLFRQGIRLPYEQLRSMSLYDACEHIVQQFALLKTPKPALLQLMETVFSFNARKSMNRSEFLDYWALQKEKIYIKTPEHTNAITITTIHKAKGLEYPIVMYPFAVTTKPPGQELIWLEDVEGNPTKLNHMLVALDKKLEETKFSDAYTNEIQKKLLDTLNLMYVTFTRPTDRLYIFSRWTKKLETFTKIETILQYFVQSVSSEPAAENTWVFGTKAACSLKQKHATLPAFPIDEISSVAWQNRIVLAPVPVKNKQTERGIRMHTLLSRLQHIDQLAALVEQARLPEAEAAELFTLIDTCIKTHALEKYFNQTGQTLNEIEVLHPSGKLLRPDRVVVHDKRLTLIDYKTGKPSETHKQQMQQYASVFREMGYDDIQMLLLYFDSNEIIFV